MELKLLSLNVRGLRDSNKRKEIFRWLKRHHNASDNFVFLQETHSLPKDETSWERDWGSKIVFGHGSSTSKGVAIMFPQKYNCEVLNPSACDNGRKVYVTIKDDHECYTLLNIYAPTKDNVNEHL